MKRALLVIGCVVLLVLPSGVQASPVEAVANAVNALAKLTQFLIERYDAGQKTQVADAVPNIIKEFVLLSSEKESLASRLDQISPSTSDPQLAADIETQSNKIVAALNRIKADTNAIDPTWVQKHIELTKAINDLRLEKVQIINGLLRYGGAEKLNRSQIAAYSKALKKEAAKLLTLAKQLASKTT